MTEGPNLLVQWSSPWQEFLTSLGPAMGRSPDPLAGEAPTGLFPLRGLLLSWGAEAIMLALAIILPGKIALLRPYRPPPLPKHEVIYFHGNELPRVEDFGGAQMGKSGAAGGNQGHHATQVIRVVRGEVARDKVVDAPNLKLPISNAPVQNLLAFKPVPGPPPAEGLKSNQAAPSLSQNAIVAPAPEVLRQIDHRLEGLDPRVVAPPPSANSEHRRDVIGLTPAIIAPAPVDIQRESGHSIVSMTSPIIQPSPDDVHREPPPLRGPAGPPNTVVPPPVSAPVREGTERAKLNLPAASVIAPPPSQVTPDRTVSGVNIADPKVVPPPVQLGGRSKDPRAIVGVTAADRIVPPPPTVSGGTALNGGGRGQGKKAGGFGTLTEQNIVPPPPGMASNADRSGYRGVPGSSLGSTAVVPPPPGDPSATDRFGSASRSAPTGLGSTAIVPPPPSLSGSTAAGGRGSGTRGSGLGGPLDAGSVLAPPSSGGGNGGGKGVIASNQPGSVMGVPAGGSPGALAMSPAGGDKPGLGGSGGGNGLGSGNGPGSGLSGAGTGAAKAGTGRGSDPNSHGGISPYPGPGGAGNGTSGQPPVPNVYVAGGSTDTVNLPSFGPGDGDPNLPGRSPTGRKQGSFDYTIEAGPRAGGGFNRYGAIKADKNYTIYIPTTAGRVVMQFGDPSSVNRVYGQELTSPEPLLYTLPLKLNGARIIIRCQLNTSGMLREFHTLEAAPGAPTVRLVAALSAWKFTPAMRGSSPVAVDVLLGFNIDTR